MAYNAITVGNLDNNSGTALSGYLIYNESCYKEDGSSLPHAEKPNLVAPGTNFWGENGTSASAPQVAGVIAQMCSYNSALKTKQTAMGAILEASCIEKVDGKYGGARGDVFSDSVKITDQISNKEGAGILNARAALGIVTSGNYWSYTFVMSFGDLDLRVYGPSGELLGTSITNNSNFEIVQFVPKTTGTYTIKISGSTSNTEHVGIAVW